jgi:hypothetical protein
MTPTTPIPAPTPCLPYHFCTYFDRNYLTRGLALYHSLRDHCRRPFILWMLCFDEESYAILRELGLDSVRLIRREDFEDNDFDLAAARGNRSLVEYYWTCTPSLLLYILSQDAQIRIITYLDADLFFFSDTQPIFDELGDQSILIHGHNYAPEYAYNEESAGIYNVGLMCFRRDAAAMECLQWWRARCNEWCYARHEDGKFGDQKYLDDWPQRFARLVVLDHPGAGLAPWNISRYRLRVRNGEVRVDGSPLIFFHFHALKLVSRWLVLPSCEGYRISSVAMTGIYAPYLKALRYAAYICGVSLADSVDRDSWRGRLRQVLRQNLWLNGPLSAGSVSWYIGGKINAVERHLPLAMASIVRAAGNLRLRNRESHALLLRAIRSMQERGRREGGAIIIRAVAASPPILLTPTFQAAAARYILGNARLDALKIKLRCLRACNR